MGNRLLLLFLVLAAMTQAVSRPRAHAQAETDAGARIVVRIPTDPTLGELPDRIEGQTSDLGREVVRAPEPPIEPSLPEQMATASALGSGDRDVVVWVQRLSDRALLVHVAQNERLLARTVDAEGTGVSPLMEAAALLVRSIVGALAAGGEIGVESHAPLADSPAEPEPEPEPEAEPEPAPEVAAAGALTSPTPPDDSAPEHPFAVQMAAGWQLAYDGHVAHHALAARVGILLNGFVVGFAATLGAPASLEDQLARLELQRTTVAAYLGTPISLGYDLSLVPKLMIGASFVSRSTTPLSPDVSARDPRTSTSGFTSAEIVLAWRLPIHSGVSLFAAVGLDGVLPPPRFAYEIDGRRVSRANLKLVQPRVGLGLAIEVP